jgi:hypothetical protein
LILRFCPEKTCCFVRDMAIPREKCGPLAEKRGTPPPRCPVRRPKPTPPPRPPPPKWPPPKPPPPPRPSPPPNPPPPPRASAPVGKLSASRVRPIMLSILFVFILVRSPEPHVGAIARLRDFVVSLRSECTMSGQNMASERPKVRSIPNIRCASARTARRDKIDIRAWTLSAQQPNPLRMVIENQDAPYRSLKFFANGAPSVTNHGRKYYFFAITGLGEAAGAAATRTTSPLTRESGGLLTILSVRVTPLVTSILVPKSRPTLMSRNSTVLSGLRTPTCKLRSTHETGQDRGK